MHKDSEMIVKKGDTVYIRTFDITREKYHSNRAMVCEVRDVSFDGKLAIVVVKQPNEKMTRAQEDCLKVPVRMLETRLMYPTYEAACPSSSKFVSHLMPGDLIKIFDPFVRQPDEVGTVIKCGKTLVDFLTTDGKMDTTLTNRALPIQRVNRCNDVDPGDTTNQ